MLSEVARASAYMVGYVRAEAASLCKRNVLHDDTGDDPEARVAEVRHRMELIAELLRKVELHARRSHTALGHIGVRMNPDEDESQAAIP
ncbi:hypothetical protein ACIBKY_52710 [Nonomuraea sp. NPDC050394]|uniref:hypothetical protein n=1 Tax=Nonomuraea sp. NPDC050394 TaxID=3364363 RepID=UPI0037AF835C